MITGFHRNKVVECGLLACTKKMLENPPEFPLDFNGPREKIGCVKFLRLHTSATEWETFKSMLERAIKLDPTIYDISLQVTLCHLVKNGDFERKGRVFRRIVKQEKPKVVKLPRATTGRVKRKVTQQDW